VLKSFLIVLFGLLLITSCTQKQNEYPARSKSNINLAWLYSENTTRNINTIQSEQYWENVNLPHSWNSEDATDNLPGYRRSASWYKKHLAIERVNQNQKYLLYFEGANITSTIYVNGKEAGGHIGGYIGFEIDITDYVKNGNNEIYVRVDNGYNRDVIPSQKSDFFIYGGITRDVWLRTEPLTAIGKVKITTPKVSKETASLQLIIPAIEIDNISEVKLKAVLIDPSGKQVASKVVEASSAKQKIVIDNINSPKLWDTQNPNLYAVNILLLKNDTVIDEVSEQVGFRWFEFKEHGPFYLNGERLLLRGTHRHEEHAGVGAAMSNELHRKDMELLKEMGTNFVRLAHYPQDPEIYNACDELGLLVWDELPWCRGGLGEEKWQENTKTMLKEIIDQNYNHPSIIIWSLGNEMYWLPDFEDGGNTEKMNIFLKELNTIAHEMDPTRKTAIRKYYEGADIVDVFSPSIWSGWYSGSYKSYQKAIDTYKPQYKHFLHTEYGGSSHVGRHTENPITGEGIIQSDGWEEAIVQNQVANIAQIGDWSENYIVDLFDWHLRISETDSSFVGNAQWAFKDFGTPLRPENDIPYINQKGLVDRNGNPKDAFYVFKSYWAEDPFVYIESKTWTDRQGPENLSRSINVFSNCKEVRLIHNGKDLGKRIKDITNFPASGLVWDVDFKKGQNELIAVSETNSGVVRDTLTVSYTYTKNGAAKRLALSSEKLENGNYLVTATARDSNGLRCLNYNEKVYFQCMEGGSTLKNQGTPTGSEIINMSNGKASIEVIPDQSTNEIEVMVMNQNFKGTYLSIKN
jgi:beta-galactosidase